MHNFYNIRSSKLSHINFLYFLYFCCHLIICRVNTPRKQGGLGNMKIPLLADKTAEISKAYGVLKEDAGIAFRYQQCSIKLLLVYELLIK